MKLINYIAGLLYISTILAKNSKHEDDINHIHPEKNEQEIEHLNPTLTHFVPIHVYMTRTDCVSETTKESPVTKLHNVYKVHKNHKVYKKHLNKRHENELEITTKIDDNNHTHDNKVTNTMDDNNNHDKIMTIDDNHTHDKIDDNHNHEIDFEVTTTNYHNHSLHHHHSDDNNLSSTTSVNLFNGTQKSIKNSYILVLSIFFLFL